MEHISCFIYMIYIIKYRLHSFYYLLICLFLNQVTKLGSFIFSYVDTTKIAYTGVCNDRKELSFCDLSQLCY